MFCTVVCILTHGVIYTCLLCICSILHTCKPCSTSTLRRTASWASDAETSFRSWTTLTPTGGRAPVTARRACSHATTSRLSIGTCKGKKQAISEYIVINGPSHSHTIRLPSSPVNTRKVLWKWKRHRGMEIMTENKERNKPTERSGEATQPWCPGETIIPENRDVFMNACGPDWAVRAKERLNPSIVKHIN